MMLQLMQRPTQQRTDKKRRNSGDPDCVTLDHDLAEHLTAPVQNCASETHSLKSMAAVYSYLKFLKRLRQKIRNHQ
jgi:hypothetical protein